MLRLRRSSTSHLEDISANLSFAPKDCIISCRNGSIGTHVMVLCAASSYFQELLVHSQGQKTAHILLPNFNKEDVQPVIDMMYGREVKLDVDRVDSVCQCARHLKVDFSRGRE